MATSQDTIDYLLDQLGGLRGVRARKMFGEYALYKDDKVVALVCDDRLFVKITEPGRAFVGDRYREGFPYPGAKPAMLIDEDDCERREWLAELIAVTATALPKPKPKSASAPQRGAKAKGKKLKSRP